MKRTVIATIMVAAWLSLASPAMAMSSTLCSFLSQISEMVGGAIDGVVANNCGTAATTPPGNTAVTPTGGGNPTVATTEPLVVLGVGLGLIGARLLRRR